jgi:hypothetical protein
VAFFCTFAASPAAAQSPPPGPGQYVTDRGWGHLVVRPAEAGAVPFELNAVGANGHTCELGGSIVDGLAAIGSDVAGEKCVVRFRALKGGGVSVEADPSSVPADACRAFCGARATFEGDYNRPEKGCDDGERDATRKRFQAHYDAKRFSAALATLDPLLSACSESLTWLEEARIRNDLALTHYRLNDMRGCRAVLAPLAKDAKLSDDDIRANYPPADADDYLPEVKAARANLALCRTR